MSEIDELIKDIDNLKENLNELIDRKNFNLQDPEIIKASQELNKVITKYNNLITKKLWQGLIPQPTDSGFAFLLFSDVSYIVDIPIFTLLFLTNLYHYDLSHTG